MADGGEFHVDIHDGPSPGAGAVLFVHGILTCRAHWTLNLPAFRRRYRAAVIELYGHGRSPAPDDLATYHPDRYAERFERIRESLGLERWYVVGQSLGAALTLNYALAHPERVIAHVVTNSHSAFGDPLRMRNPDGARDRAQQMIDGGIEAVLEHPLYPSRARTLSEAQRRAFDRDMAASTPLGIARTMMHTSPYLPVRDRLRENVVPTLLIAGDREEGFRSGREWVEAHAANVEVVRVPATHAVNLSTPEAFNRHALEFFARFD